MKAGLPKIVMPIKVYGATWCHMTRDTLYHLKRLKLEHEYIDIDKNREAAAWVRAQNDGKEKKPTLDINGTILTEPDDDELDEVLRDLKILT